MRSRMEFTELDEGERLRRLYACNILDTPAEKSFDDIVELASILCDAPIANISFVDTDRQWFKAKRGFDHSETARSESFCTYTIRQPDHILEIPDASMDSRFMDYPFVKAEPSIRFYAGAPLVTKDGYALGSLCVMDYKPRNLTDNQLRGLELLADRVVAQLDARNNDDELRKLAMVVDRSDNIVMITDKDSRIEYVNPRFEILTGYSREAVYSRNPWDIFDHPDNHGIKEKLIDGFKKGESVTTDIVNITKDNKKLILSSTLIPLFDDNGNLMEKIVIQRDVTSYRQKEQELIESKEAALESARLKQQFLSNMSHEIRTPMNGIIGLSNLLLEEDLSQEHHDTIYHIKNSANNLLRLINDILDLSKANAGKLVFKDQKFKLKQTFEGLDKVMGVLAKEKGLNFYIKLGSNLPEEVIGDSGRLLQILLNLVSNAIKFTEYGSVTIDVEQEEINKIGPKLKVSVIDTGVGVSENEFESIFGEFEQAKSYTRDNSSGTGLGLSITKRLVEMYNGEISVKSTLGKGSTFEFTVQLKNASVEVTNKMKLVNEANQASELADTKILLVEDNRVNQIVCTKYLEKVGCKLTIVNNGLEGIQAFQKEDFDLIIMDVQMPVMNGLDATAQIRKEDPSIPIIGMTASVMEYELDKCLEAGMDTHLPKPFKKEDLYNTVAKMINLRKRPQAV